MKCVRRVIGRVIRATYCIAVTDFSRCGLVKLTREAQELFRRNAHLTVTLI